MATWRVFKKQEEIRDPGTVAVWAEFPPIETEYDYWVDAANVGVVAGEGRYLLVSDERRALTIEVRAVTRYEEVEQPEAPTPTEEPGFSVAVTDEQQ